MASFIPNLDEQSTNDLYTHFDDRMESEGKIILLNNLTIDQLITFIASIDNENAKTDNIRILDRK